MIRAFDMFCGGGGSSRGAFLAGATPVAGLDMWSLATEAYQLNFPDAVTYNMKASSLAPQRVLDEVGPIDLLLASPECTNHSVAKGNAPRCEKSRATAFEVIRFAKVLRPRWMVIENVIQMRTWSRFDEWMKKIEALGYNTRRLLMDAQDYGTPTSRRRLMIVCDLNGDPTLPQLRSVRTKTAADILCVGEPRSQQWDFSPLARPGRSKATLIRARRAIADVGPKEPFIMVYYGTDGAGGYQRLDRPLRTVTTLDRFAFVRPTSVGYEMRMLQPPELAAAMGFPRSHRWPETTRRNRIKLIGNAVCPPVMKAAVVSLTKAA